MGEATDIFTGVVRFSAETDFDENSVTPGVIGFIAIFLIAAVTILLLLDMTRRIRRTRYRGEIAERLDAEETASGTSRIVQEDPDGPPSTDDRRNPLR